MSQHGIRFCAGCDHRERGLPPPNPFVEQRGYIVSANKVTPLPAVVNRYGIIQHSPVPTADEADAEDVYPNETSADYPNDDVQRQGHDERGRFVSKKPKKVERIGPQVGAPKLKPQKPLATRKGKGRT